MNTVRLLLTNINSKGNNEGNNTHHVKIKTLQLIYYTQCPKTENIIVLIRVGWLALGKLFVHFNGHIAYVHAQLLQYCCHFLREIMPSDTKNSL